MFMLATLAAGALYRRWWLGTPAAEEGRAAAAVEAQGRRDSNTPTADADASLSSESLANCAPFFDGQSARPSSPQSQFNASVRLLFPSASPAVIMCDEEVAALVVDNGSGMCKVKL